MVSDGARALPGPISLEIGHLHLWAPPLHTLLQFQTGRNCSLVKIPVEMKVG